MWNFFRVLLAVVSLILVLAIVWRFISYRWQLPCPSWLGWMVEADNPFTKINRSANIIKSLELQQGMNVLDAGCGPGRITIPMAQKVGSQGTIFALDIQKEMLEWVKEKAHTANLNNIIFICVGLGDGKLEQNKYDRATLVTVLGEILNQKKALQEIFNALKPGAILSITETLFDPHYQRFSVILNLAQQVGFQKKKVFSDWFSYNLLLEKPISMLETKVIK